VADLYNRGACLPAPLPSPSADKQDSERRLRQMAASPRGAGEAAECRKKFKALPFANTGRPRGRLNVDCKKLRVDPAQGGASMTAEDLRDLCTGLSDNTNVTHLDLDGNQFALGAEDEDTALEPLVELCRTNRTLTMLDISNNGLCFEEGSAQLDSLEQLVLGSNLVELIIGGNMDIDEELLEKLAGWVMKSERRWRNVGLGKIDEDDEKAANNLRATVRQAANAAEAAALVDFFNRPRPTARAPLQSMQSPGVVATSPAAAACPAQAASPGGKRTAESDASSAKRQKAQPAAEQTSTPTPPATAAAAAAATVAAPAAPVAPSAPAAPAGASEERCKAFLAAFHDIREDDDHVEKAGTLAQIAQQLGGGYEQAEMEYYLSCMVELNFIMVTGGMIYII
jgi:hypothetical protein